MLEPAGTRTVAGTVRFPGTPTVTFTSQPPAGAGDANVIVAVEDVPPLTLVGLNESPVMESPLIANKVDLLVTPSAP